MIQSAIFALARAAPLGAPDAPHHPHQYHYRTRITYGVNAETALTKRRSSGFFSFLPEAIDYRAFAFDMGKAGRRALETLRDGGTTPDIGRRAKDALAAKNGWDVNNPTLHDKPEKLQPHATVFPAGTRVPPQLWAGIPGFNACANLDLTQRCIIRIWEDRGVAALLTTFCKDNCPTVTLLLYRHTDGSWATEPQGIDANSGPIARGQVDKARWPSYAPPPSAVISRSGRLQRINCLSAPNKPAMPSRRRSYRPSHKAGA